MRTIIMSLAAGLVALSSVSARAIEVGSEPYWWHLKWAGIAAENDSFPDPFAPQHNQYPVSVSEERNRIARLYDAMNVKLASWHQTVVAAENASDPQLLQPLVAEMTQALTGIAMFRHGKERGAYYKSFESLDSMSERVIGSSAARVKALRELALCVAPAATSRRIALQANSLAADSARIDVSGDDCSRQAQAFSRLAKAAAEADLRDFPGGKKR